ncbi:hypothetical protein J31TS4_42620 [Paenibacillus sp. J31TS4]|uniref:flagellar biosynthesis anti-sigma factor FlgM n=1 Tax=Paenibacillus sp. J31TS4 TaxID=2807195 RepID=UPI001B0BD6A7|nr:flagellar biosynthesis anti-sigma factor FlgM [Paenibacillus sp. J31TS4]GIP40982.1 hypothetical protein J31TS4_42620 [Paenibacillus sp. J31TS4]
MKINETQRIGAIHSYNRSQQQAQAQAERKKQKDEVHISAEAKELQQSSGAGASQEARREQIEALKKAVSSGTYHVEAGKIAEKLLPYLK